MARIQSKYVDNNALKWENTIIQQSWEKITSRCIKILNDNLASL